jgi:hypothetical protein
LPVGSLIVLGVVALTSLGCYLAGAGVLGLRRDKLVPAMTETLEYLGLTAVFLAVNLAVGMALVLVLRALTGSFISVYWLKDITLVLLSFGQAFLFQIWRRTPK